MASGGTQAESETSLTYQPAYSAFFFFFPIQFCNSCSYTVVNLSSNYVVTEIRSSSHFKERASTMKASYYHIVLPSDSDVLKKLSLLSCIIAL